MKLTNRQYAAIRDKKLWDATERELAEVEQRALRVIALLDLALNSPVARTALEAKEA